MKLISHQDIANLNISPYQCYEWVSEIIKNKTEMILPAKISLKPADGVFYNTMPAILPRYDIAGVKIVSRYPPRTPSLNSDILLYRLSDGEALCLINGNFITAMRTGAVAAHSIQLLAKQDFSTIAIIGLGNVSGATVKVLLAIYPERKFTFKLFKYKNQHEIFARTFDKYDNAEFVICESKDEFIKGSDVVISGVTVFEEDFCDESLFEKGCLLVPLHTRGFSTCDLTFDKIFADDRAHVEGFRYFDKFKSFAEVTDVVAGKAPGRTSDDERIIAYNIGIAIHDIFYAKKIFDMSPDCLEFQQNAETQKFWV